MAEAKVYSAKLVASLIKSGRGEKIAIEDVNKKRREGKLILAHITYKNVADSSLDEFLIELTKEEEQKLLSRDPRNNVEDYTIWAVTKKKKKP